jgi:hypothetical protein
MRQPISDPSSNLGFSHGGADYGSGAMYKQGSQVLARYQISRTKEAEESLWVLSSATPAKHHLTAIYQTWQNCHRRSE